jgi:hypothetical protein
VVDTAFVVRANGRGLSCFRSDDYRFQLNVDGKEIIALARSSEAFLEISDVVLRLLATSVVHSVILSNWSCPADVSINAASLAYLMEQCHSLKTLTLKHGEALSEDHCRALGAYSRPGLDIVLKCCKITSAAAVVLAQVLGRNQGPTKLSYCHVDICVLADGLRGNSRLRSLKPRIVENHLIACSSPSDTVVDSPDADCVCVGYLERKLRIFKKVAKGGKPLPNSFHR